MNDLELAFKQYREAANNVIWELLHNVENNNVEVHKAAIVCCVIERTGNTIANLLNIQMEVQDGQS